MGIRSILAAALLAAAFVAAACGGSLRSDDARGNYRILTARETTTLLQFARSVQRCAVAQGLRLEAPKVSRTRIELLPVGHWSLHAAVVAIGACEPKTGPPPAKSSLVANRSGITVFVPKRCLLDPKVAKHAA